MNGPANALYSASYREARDRFATAAQSAGWQLVSHPTAATGPEGETLTIDVASSPGSAPRTLLVTSGLHGVEGYFGSAIQLDLLEEFIRGTFSIPENCRIVLVHALNPYGFAHDRRTDDANIDLNRNFLLPGQSFAGSPPGYDELDSLINPSRLGTLFVPRMLWKGCVMGFTAVKSAIAAGQYDHPRGLFYGGHSPSPSFAFIERELPAWIPPGSEAAILVDLHSGLGRCGASTLLTELSAEERRHSPLAQGFAADEISGMHASEIAYPARGTFTAWLTAYAPSSRFHAWGLEFGTTPGLPTLAALRAENHQHFFGDSSSPAFRETKANLRDVFCPSNPQWRTRVIHRASGVLRRTLQVLHQS